MKMGILGAGRIAGTMAGTICKMENVMPWAVASRSLVKAQKFAKEYGFQRAYGSYEELVSDPEIDLIYIATPHSHHYAHMKLCIEHGKPVLTEKSFTQNVAQAREVLALAEEKGVFVTEAIWTRYMPMRKTLDEILKSGVIGEPYSLYATLSYPITHKERMVDPALAGGALLDIGVYAVNFASMVFGDDLKEVKASAVLTDRGVDASDSITLLYRDGKMAVLHSDMRAADNREGAVYGDKGYIIVQNINNCEEIRVYDSDHNMTARYERPEQITGYEYEVEACRRAIENHALECQEMPHAETIRIMELMDHIRAQMGVIYPNER
ncbi:MAG: Gfo/Idh/MocA family oxidoreductase [Eubacteriales bacterium]|nr:Gfo/Idh/MocA family oxidoreductase [Eubacteriales bacterium]